MINNSLIKNLVVNNFVKDTDVTDYERCAIECITYTYISALLDSSTSNDASSLISLYASKLKAAFLNTSGTYVSYNNVINYLKTYNLTNLLVLNDDQIDEVSTLYADTTKLVAFSVLSFDPLMYGVENLNSTQLSYLQQVHFNVISKIIEYYHDIYGVNYSALKVEIDSAAIDNPGKIIDFYIDGIDSSRVYADIIKKTVYIDYYKVRCIYPKIQIINV